jgi:hypothetical protein
METYPKEAGIYKLTCKNNGKIYIGKSINLHKRLNQHRYRENNTKGRWYLENAIIKHGWNSFDVEILEIFENFDKSKNNIELLELETFYIKKYNSANKDIGYNIQKHSGDGAGVPKKPFSEEHRAKLRIARAKQIRGPLSKERIDKMRVPRPKHIQDMLRTLRVGKTISEEHKQKISQCGLGRKNSPETIEKMRNAKLGKKHTEEAKMKMSEAKKGKSNNLKGRKHSEETKMKMSESRRGKPSPRLGVILSEETKEKIRQSKLKGSNK